MMPLKYAEIQSASEDTETFYQIPVSLIREVGKMILDSGVKIVLIKAGERGAYLLTGDVSSINEKNGILLPEESWNFRELWCEAYHAHKSKIISTNGAGDTAVAAFLSAMLDGLGAESSLKYAAMAGRNTLYCHNIHTDLGDWQEMTKGIDSEPNEIVHLYPHLETTPDINTEFRTIGKI
jgi:sugar/nucleoside kinase (ribokinase family)